MWRKIYSYSQNLITFNGNLQYKLYHHVLCIWPCKIEVMNLGLESFVRLKEKGVLVTGL